MTEAHDPMHAVGKRVEELAYLYSNLPTAEDPLPINDEALGTMQMTAGILNGYIRRLMPGAGGIEGDKKALQEALVEVAASAMLCMDSLDGAPIGATCPDCGHVHGEDPKVTAERRAARTRRKRQREARRRNR